MGGDALLAVALSVCAGCGQLIAQQRRAVATAGESTCICASLQQSIMPLISFECSGTPASALPPNAKTSAKAESRFIIANENYMEETSGLSIPIRPKSLSLVHRIRRLETRLWQRMCCAKCPQLVCCLPINGGFARQYCSCH